MYQVESKSDSQLTWPLYGKQITMGIVEQGKSITERVTMRRSITTEPEKDNWKNPSEYSPTNRGWSKFLSHDLLFYRGWDYVFEDTMKFSFMVTEVTAVFMDCDVSEGPFYHCLYHQDSDDDQDFDSKGELHTRGLAKLRTIPTYQWGERCLAINIKASASFTLSIAGEFLNEEIFQKGTTIPWYRQRVYPTEMTQYV